MIYDQWKMIFIHYCIFTTGTELLKPVVQLLGDQDLRGEEGHGRILDQEHDEGAVLLSKLPFALPFHSVGTGVCGQHHQGTQAPRMSRSSRGGAVSCPHSAGQAEAVAGHNWHGRI